jgi:hypothetical protein
MIDLPIKFKESLGDGVRTSLYPLVVIYKGMKIDENFIESTDTINLSTKSAAIKGFDGIYKNYDPILMSLPSINSKADIINNKYTISSVSLKISNSNYNGKMFSDSMLDYLNSVCQIYYSSNGIDDLSDCLLTYTGTIRRYNQDTESVNLVLEDLTQQKLSTKIPVSTIEDIQYYREDDIGKPFPMVYGYVDKSPVIPKAAGRDDMGELREDLAKFHIDKIGKNIKGLWEAPNENNYSNDFINANHFLVTSNYIKSAGTLSVYENDFLPIPQNMNVEGWSFYVNGITDPEESGYTKITSEDIGGLVYQFEQTDGSTTSASIRFLEGALINSDDIQGIPTRIYRPIKKVECYTYCDSNNGDDMNAVNRIYGFDNYEGNESQLSDSNMYFIPWKENENMDRTFYENNWDYGDASMWEPTVCNENTNGHANGAVDENWKTNTNIGLFPVDRLQNGDLKSGIYICGRNADGSRISGDNKSGMAYVRFIFEDNVGSFPCSSKIIFDSSAHCFSGMTGDYGDGHQAVACSSIWIGDSVPVYSGNLSTNITNLKSGSFFSYLPFNDYDDFGDEWSSESYDSQSNTEGSLKIEGGYKELSLFNNTTYSDHINFGIEQFPKQGQSKGNDRQYVATQMYNFYLLNDAVIENPLDKEFYADVVGRTNEEYIINEPMQLGSATHYGLEGVFWYSVVEFLEPHNLNAGNTFEIYKSDDTYKGEYSVSAVINDWKIKINSENLGDCDNGYVIVPSHPVITDIQSIFKDIVTDELEYEGNINLSQETDPWLYSFTLSEQEEAKDVIEDLFKASLFMPIYNSKGEFKITNIHQTLNDEIENKIIINNENILKCSFSLTKLDDIKNSINIKYNFEYASSEFKNQTGYLIKEGEPDIYTFDNITRDQYPNNPEYWYDVNYYGLKDVDAKLEVETKYIRDESTAKKLQKKLLNWYANQHLIVKLDLPVSYMNLEVGDYIEFNELVGGKLAFGYDYTKHTNKNGQLAYKYFFITSLNKSLDKISLEAVQVHRGEYGFFDGWDEDSEDVGGTVGNFEIEDWQDSGDYDEEVIVDEEIEPDEPIFELEFLGWINGNDNLQYLNPIFASVVATQTPSYALFVIDNPEEYQYCGEFGQTQEMCKIVPRVTTEDDPVLLGDINSSEYLNVQLNTNASGQLSNIQISCDYNLPYLHSGIVFQLSLYRADTGSFPDNPEDPNYYVGDENIYFTQTYFDESSVILGDVNGDGTINILDVVLIVQHILSGGANLTGDALEAADFNDDGTINVLDVVATVNLILAGGG